MACALLERLERLDIEERLIRRVEARGLCCEGLPDGPATYRLGRGSICGPGLHHPFSPLGPP